MPNGEHGWRIERSTIGVVTAVMIAVALIPVGYSAGVALTNFQNKQDSIIARLDRIEKHMDARQPEDFKRSDMNEWCADARNRNPEFTCPDPYALPSYLRRWGRAGQRK